jgi:hypothetical protein
MKAALNLTAPEKNLKLYNPILNTKKRLPPTNPYPSN